MNRIKKTKDIFTDTSKFMEQLNEESQNEESREFLFLPEKNEKNFVSLFGDRLSILVETGDDPGWPSDMSEEQCNLVERLKNTKGSDDATDD